LGFTAGTLKMAIYSRKIEIPVPHVTSCAFAGKNLDHLMITTARGDLNDDELKKYPESGNVFF
jgi:sugar lactone lactonase YvrE